MNSCKGPGAMRPLAWRYEANSLAVKTTGEPDWPGRARQSIRKAGKFRHGQLQLVPCMPVSFADDGRS